MGEIEEVVRRREAEARTAVAIATQEAAQKEERRRLELIARVEVLVPKALQALEAAGWPDAQLVTVRTKRRWGRKVEEMACWEVGWKPVAYKEGSGKRSMRLLRDGNWLGAGEPVPFSAICKNGLPKDVEADLQKLISLDGAGS